jgi:hypothetical protein
MPCTHEEMPGALGTMLLQFGSWLSVVYEGSTLGLWEVWRHVLGSIPDRMTGDTSIQNAQVQRMAMPSSLKRGSSLAPMAFRVDSAGSGRLKGLDRKAVCTLLESLLKVLGRDFKIQCHPGIIPAREDDGTESMKEKMTHAIVVGGSHMARVAGCLKKNGILVADLSVPGWVASPENIADLKAKIEKIDPPPGTVCYAGTLDNGAFRYIQPDGTQAMSFKSGGHYHMGGHITVVGGGRPWKNCARERLKFWELPGVTGR